MVHNHFVLPMSLFIDLSFRLPSFLFDYQLFDKRKVLGNERFKPQ